MRETTWDIICFALVDVDNDCRPYHSDYESESRDRRTGRNLSAQESGSTSIPAPKNIRATE